MSRPAANARPSKAKRSPSPKRNTRRNSRHATPDPRSTVLTFGKTLYPDEAVLHTCALFSPRARFDVSENDTSFVVSISPLRGSTDNHLPDLSAEFKEELIHQVLRFRLAAESRKIREAIIEQALFAALPRDPAGPPAPDQVAPRVEGPKAMEEIREEDIDRELEEILKEVEAEDFKEDPLGIAIPWEEKHPKKKDDKSEC